jgi:hypothetical protein
LAELTFPARSTVCALALLTFVLLIMLAVLAGPLGLWLGILIVPAMFRFLAGMAEARAKGTDVEPPGIELFTLGGNGWTLFPVAALLLVAWSTLLRDTHPATAAAFAVGGVLLFPAMLAVLVITHSPLQALHPAALIDLVRRLGPAYLWAPAVGGLAWMATGISLPFAWTGQLLALYALFALHALVGGLIREKGLIDEIDIPSDEALDAGIAEARLGRERKRCLNHAYGFFSRGNRAGALAHLEGWLDEDPEPDAARAWFQEQMLGWEDRTPALYFGQQHLGALLRQGKTVPAVKLMLRLRRVDERFRPEDADLPAAIAAARSSGNGELVAALSAGTPAGTL